MRKLAIFIAGPYRYVDHLLDQIDNMELTVPYDYFIHIWKEDLGDKIRKDETKNLRNLQENRNTKLFIYQQPYNEETYLNDLGEKSGGHSKNHAVIGMFISMNLLCHNLSQLPDFKSYTHILRLRTDNIIINNNLFKRVQWKKGIVNLSLNYSIPESWISDHMMLTDTASFFKLWKYKNMNEVYRAYIKGLRNPEIALRRKWSSKLRKNLLFIRYLDYHIIYNPPKEGDPEEIQLIIKQNGPKYLFDHYTDIDTHKLEEHVDNLKIWNKNKYKYSGIEVFIKQYMGERIYNLAQKGYRKIKQI